MSVEMKLGRWEDGQGGVWRVRHQGHVMADGKSRQTWVCECGRWWFDGGRFYDDGSESPYDLIRYLGPLELSPTPARADQAGTPVVSTVSTETAGESLRRMRAQHQAINRAACAYRDLAQAAERAASELEGAISRLEREVDG